jgi:cobalamin biosynthesis protein CbiD
VENHNEVEQYIYVGDKRLQYGYTTGSCAACAAKAAAYMLFSGKEAETISLYTPKGIKIYIDILDIYQNLDTVKCAVKKNSGDDPDVTNGISIYASVSKVIDTTNINKYIYEEEGISLNLSSGLGVGVVTKSGLSSPVGYPAINEVPRKMIFEEVANICKKFNFNGELEIKIYVPSGEETAKRTFNERLGIVGGISILGTSGIVEPMSEKALVETIRIEMKQQISEGFDTILITPGNYGSNFTKTEFNTSIKRGVKCSNYIGESIRIARQLGITNLILIGHIGKLIKLAIGAENTHSKYGDGRMEIMSSYAALCGADSNIIKSIMEAVTTEAGIAVLEKNDLKDKVMEKISLKIFEKIRNIAGESMKIECVVFANTVGIVGATNGAGDMIDKWKSLNEGDL